MPIKCQTIFPNHYYFKHWQKSQYTDILMVLKMLSGTCTHCQTCKLFVPKNKSCNISWRPADGRVGLKWTNFSPAAINKNNSLEN